MSRDQMSDAPSRAKEGGAETYPWLSEPDAKLWTDEATGLACYATRGPTGAWYGYVRVDEGHPAFEFHYGVYSVDFDDLASGKWTPDRIRTQSLINDISVHGGLTFASRCRARDCGEPGGYWFGFDCAHAGDFSPKYDRVDDPVLGLGKPTGWGGVITYRTLPYVEDQCASLAKQLAAIAAATGQQSEAR